MIMILIMIIMVSIRSPWECTMWPLESLMGKLRAVNGDTKPNPAPRSSSAASLGQRHPAPRSQVIIIIIFTVIISITRSKSTSMRLIIIILLYMNVVTTLITIDAILIIQRLQNSNTRFLSHCQKQQNNCKQK